MEITNQPAENTEGCMHDNHSIPNAQASLSMGTSLGPHVQNEKPSSLTVEEHSDHTNVASKKASEGCTPHTESSLEHQLMVDTAKSKATIASSSSTTTFSPKKKEQLNPSIAVQSIIPHPTSHFMDDRQVSPYNESLKA